MTTKKPSPPEITPAFLVRLHALEARVKQLETLTGECDTVTTKPAPIGGSAYNPATSNRNRRKT